VMTGGVGALRWSPKPGDCLRCRIDAVSCLLCRLLGSGSHLRRLPRREGAAF
jgi:hypothetical protein